MKKLLLLAAILPTTVYAQSLTDQINAVDAVQTQEELRQQAARNAEMHHIERQRAAQAVLDQKREDEKLSDKKRDQQYEDQLRALHVEATKARVARENDYIDQELKEKAARTDVIKSEADVNRNLSEGTKSLMEKEGDADIKSQSGIFR